MVQDAGQHASEDSRRRETVEAHNKADSAAYSAEKFLNENGDKIPEANKAAIRDRIEATRSALAGNDATAMNEAADQLLAVMNEAGAAMYQQAGGAAGSGPATDGQPGSDEDVIEGEFSDS
jgi:molecular chaperone DnaK